MTTTKPQTTPAATDQRSDVRLVADVGEILAVPRSDPADSFVLHAPLELVARAALLPFVPPQQRDVARGQLTALAEQFTAAGPAVAPPAPGDFDSTADASAHLAAAIDRGELDDVDTAARWLGRAASALELQSMLTPVVVDRLAAAAHAPIFLYQLPRIAPRGEITGELLRGLARELARAPEWRVHWIDERQGAGDATSAAMFDALASTPLGTREPGATPFIYPVMAHVDEHGIAAERLNPVIGTDAISDAQLTDAGRAVLRAAAWSMVLEPDDHAPYGWSHCLTLPQAVLALAPGATDASTALAVAATYVVGFRAALAERPLEPAFTPDDPGLELGDALAAPPSIAAAAAWHLPKEERPQLVTELATRASVQHDAHLVKYTLACLDAASADPTHARLFLTAAASLVGWWAQV